MEGILKLGWTCSRVTLHTQKAGVNIKYILCGKRRKGNITVIDEYAA
jgi:hypothetical protein